MMVRERRRIDPSQYGPAVSLWREDWSFDLIQAGEHLFLAAVAGSVAIYEVAIELSDRECAALHVEGIDVLKPLAKALAFRPSDFSERLVTLPAAWSELESKFLWSSYSSTKVFLDSCLGNLEQSGSKPPLETLFWGQHSGPWRAGVWVVLKTDGWAFERLLGCLQQISSWHKRSVPLSVITLSTSTRPELLSAIGRGADGASVPWEPDCFAYFLSLDEEVLLRFPDRRRTAAGAELADDCCYRDLRRQYRSLFLS